MPTELLVALIAGGLTLLGIIVGSALTSLNSYLEHQRLERKEREQIVEQERAILNGAFALSNFLKSRLNEWSENRNVFDLARLTVAQPYIAKLTDRAPLNSERLMVSLIDLGLRLEALLFTAGLAIGSEKETSDTSLDDIANCITELDQSIELVDIIVTGELPIMTDEELSSFENFETSSNHLDVERVPPKESSNTSPTTTVQHSSGDHE
ncbi:hypothetical protein [Parasphingorhabdus sp.]|uniref:hypothetical protein n=1 Tax=Parasphingorhabdus sp. TaxID=2709688 RepID=UPI003A8D9E9A